MTVSKGSFTCNMCGNCCRGFSDEFCVILSSEDMSRAANELGLTTKDFIDGFTHSKNEKFEIYTYLNYNNAGECVFLRDNKCTINGSKPRQCELGPFGPFWDGKKRHHCMSSVLRVDICKLSFQAFRGDYNQARRKAMSGAPPSKVIKVVKKAQKKIIAGKR